METAFQNLIDNIFSLPESILKVVQDKLTSASGLVAQGLNVSDWLAPVGLLGSAWVKVINSLLAGAGIVLTVWIVKKVYVLYLQFKEGVRWW